MVFAKNDINFIFRNTRFSKCKVSFRKNSNECLYKDLLLSELINPNYMISKGQVICFCDGVLKREEASSIKEVTLTLDLVEPEEVMIVSEELREIELEKEFQGMNIVKINDIKDDRENKYIADKTIWIKHNTDNKRLISAFEHGYNCDEEYCIDRMSKELLGFFIVDHTTFIYESPYPTDIALKLEDKIVEKLHGSRSKYGTRVRVCLLEKHNGKEYNNIESIIIFNYLGKFDIVGIINEIGVKIYECE
jgi:hypothetical protein